MAEAARWFAKNGALEKALLILSNLRENNVSVYAQSIQGAIVFEALSLYGQALEFLAFGAP